VGILDWIEEKARKKMRFSQIKILYQNLFATAFLIKVSEDEAAEAETLENLRAIQTRTRAFISEIPDDDFLNDAASETLFADNRTLKKTYAGIAAEPKTAGAKGATDFAEKFKPAAGWKAFSDADWAAVVNTQGAA